MGLFCSSVHFTAKYWSKAHFYITVTAFTSDQRYIILLLKQEWWWATLWKGEPAERKGSGFASSSQGEMYVFTYPENRKLHFPSLAMPHCVFIFTHTREKWEGISWHRQQWQGGVWRGLCLLPVPLWQLRRAQWAPLPRDCPRAGLAAATRATSSQSRAPAPSEMVLPGCHTHWAPSNCKSSWSTKRAVMSLL